MTWVRIDDGAPLHPKLLDAGAEAAWLWACGLAYCNRNHTDGLIAARHLAALYPGAWPADRLGALAVRLVAVRLWDADGPDYRVHDYAHYQEEATREVVDARRVYERERKRAQRFKSRPGHVPDNVPGTIAGHVPGTNTGTPPGTDDGTEPAGDQPAPTHAPAVPAPRPVPSRPVPSRPDPGSEKNSEPVAGALRAPPTEADAPRADTPDPVAAELETLRAEKAARDAAAADAARLVIERDAARRKRNREKAAAREADPPPFSVGTAFETVAAAAGGRFAAGVERDWTGGVRIAVAKLVRAYPTLPEWERLGRWLAAGGEGYRGVVGPSWAASTACANAMALARDWHAKGGGPVGDPMKSGVHSVPRYSREAPPAAIPPPPVVKRGDLAVDRPALVPGSPEAKAAAAKMMADWAASPRTEGGH